MTIPREIQNDHTPRESRDCSAILQPTYKAPSTSDYRDDGFGLWVIILKYDSLPIVQAGLTWQYELEPAIRLEVRVT